MHCSTCSKPISLAYNQLTKQQLIDRKLCFTCNFWHNLQTEVSDEDRIVIDNHHYVALESSPDGIRGFGGRLFIIEKQDGTIIRTINLWHQGEIPEQYRDRFPNNARFVRPDNVQVQG
jgi:hypothetical protein